MKIFISHSSKDTKSLHELKKQISGYGDCFLAHEDIKVGENDLNRIKKEISKCDIFVIIGNTSSKESEYCNQEIGMAIAHKKKIISTICHTSLVPWGFLQRQQAIKYKGILEDLPCKLVEEIIKSSEYKKCWNSKLKKLERIDKKGFCIYEKKQRYIDYQKPGYIRLLPDYWNDYGYCTTFCICPKSIGQSSNEYIGPIKIGYKDQAKELATKDKLSQQFPFLIDEYFSYCDLTGSTLSTEQKNDLYSLLNDVRYNKEIAKKYIDQDVLIISLFRDKEEELEELKQKLRLQ